MPLKKSASDTARNHNVAELIHSGYKPKQAEAIAYAVQRKAQGKPPEQPKTGKGK